MNFDITDKAREKLSIMKEKNIPIMLKSYSAGWRGYTYSIVSLKQSEDDNVYNIDGINIIVPKQLEHSLKSVKIDYGGFIIKSFIISPTYSNDNRKISN